MLFVLFSQLRYLTLFGWTGAEYLVSNSGSWTRDFRSSANTFQ